MILSLNRLLLIYIILISSCIFFADFLLFNCTFSLICFFSIAFFSLTRTALSLNCTFFFTATLRARNLSLSQTCCSRAKKPSPLSSRVSSRHWVHPPSPTEDERRGLRPSRSRDPITQGMTELLRRTLARRCLHLHTRGIKTECVRLVKRKTCYLLIIWPASDPKRARV